MAFIATKEELQNSELRSGRPLRQAANQVVLTASMFYRKARIPTVHEYKMAEKIENLYSEMQELMKIPQARRKSGKPASRIQKFKEELEQTFPFWPRDALERISNPEDQEFLRKMMKDWTASMGGVDMKLASTERKVLERKQAEQIRQEREIERQLASQCSAEQNDQTLSSESDEPDEDFIPPP